MRFKPNVYMKFEIQDSRRLKYFFELMWFMRMPDSASLKLIHAKAYKP